jgi:hypothetical protein
MNNCDKCKSNYPLDIKVLKIESSIDRIPTLISEKSDLTLRYKTPSFRFKILLF